MPQAVADCGVRLGGEGLACVFVGGLRFCGVSQDRESPLLLPATPHLGAHPNPGSPGPDPVPPTRPLYPPPSPPKRVFSGAVASGGVVKAIRVPDGARISNSRLKPKGDVANEAAAAGASGLAFARVLEGGGLDAAKAIKEGLSEAQAAAVVAAAGAGPVGGVGRGRGGVWRACGGAGGGDWVRGRVLGRAVAVGAAAAGRKVLWHPLDTKRTSPQTSSPTTNCKRPKRSYKPNRVLNLPSQTPNPNENPKMQNPKTKRTTANLPKPPETSRPSTLPQKRATCSCLPPAPPPRSTARWTGCGSTWGRTWGSSTVGLTGFDRV